MGHNRFCPQILRVVGWMLLVWGLGGVAWGQEGAFRGAADRWVDIEHIRLELDVDLEGRSIAGRETIRFSVIRPTAELKLNGVDFRVEGVREVLEGGKEGGKLEFENTGEEVIVKFGEVLPRGAKREVVMGYGVSHPKSGLHFFRPTPEEPNVPWMVWSQGEPISNRYWFACLDHPNERQSTEVIANVDARFEVLSNGRLVERKLSADGKRARVHWVQDKPHAAYLVTLVAGEFAVVTESWRGKPVTYYGPVGREGDLRLTFGNTPEMLEFFSERFGIEYPWEKYAQVVVEQFIAGGMENTSATTMYQQMLRDGRWPADGNSDWIIAHELGHQWWGDLVTCKDWSQLWLNEGFASYCEIVWAEHKYGRDEADYQLYEDSRSARGAAPRPIVDRRYAEPSQMFDARVYPKGEWVLHMLRRRVGDEDFFESLKRYGLANAYRTVETSDLRKTFSELTGLSLERFFFDWTERAGHPRLAIKAQHDSGAKVMQLEVEQQQEGEAFEFPLVVEFVGANAEKRVRMERMISEKKVTWLIPVVDRPVMVRIDPEFGLLAEIREEKSRDWWETQLFRGPTVPERIRAVEHFSETKSDEDRRLVSKVLAEDGFYGVRIEAARGLARMGGEIARDGLIAGLKDEEPRVRRACAEGLREFRGDERVIGELKGVALGGDKSAATRGAALRSLGVVDEHLKAEFLQKGMEQESPSEVIRQGALESLGLVKDAGAYDVLLSWMRRGHAWEARRAAMYGMATFVGRNDVSQGKRSEVIETLVKGLREEGPRLRIAAADSLRMMGNLAEGGVEALVFASKNDADGRVRAAADRAAREIQRGKPPEQQVEVLRSELQRLRELNERLEDRLERLEVR